MLQEVTQLLMADDCRSTIPQEKVRAWMANEHLEVLGAVFKLLHKPEHYTRIQPAFGFRDYCEFHLKYFERCLREDCDGTWCDSRYMAAHSLVNWFREVWTREGAQSEAARKLKELLTKVYKEGDKAIRTCVVTGVLEHLFTDKSILRFFSDWQGDAHLKGAYFEGLNFSSGPNDQN